MRRRTIFLALLLLGLSVAGVHADSISARVAASVMPVPTFAEVHRAYMRIVVNESGFRNLADQDGILRSMLWSGGGRRPGRSGRGTGYGLDYRALMKRMAAHSKRTFPLDSKFLLMTSAERTVLAKRQTRLNRWTSTLQLDCSEPKGWPKTKRDGSRAMDPWRAAYGERCELVVETTRAFLKGRMKSHCDEQPTTWGSVPDTYRPGGPLENGWLEIVCDRPNPDKPEEDCDKLAGRALLNSTTCARNHFWSWLEKGNGDGERTVSARRNDSPGGRAGEGDPVRSWVLEGSGPGVRKPVRSKAD